MLPDVAWGQVAATLPEVTVVAPRPAPSPPRRQAPAARRAAASPPVAPASTPVPSALPAYQVIATTPVTGIGFDRNKVPAMAQTVTAEDFSRVYSPNVLDTLQQRIPGVITTDVQGNGFFQDLRYRGFAASPLQGTPQGLAVYMQGVRINEAFGDTVNWDLIPTVAIGRADIWTNNPAFGLNALGGAVSLQMKDGFNYNGFEFDASGGSYGRVGGSMQYGVRSGEWGLYLAAEGFKDDGWRYQSPSRIARFYGDLGWRGTDAEVHFITSIADNYFGVVGPTPLQLINNDYRSIYTWPQTTKNQAQLIAMNGRYSVSDHWTVQSNLYLRKFQQAHVDGNAAEVERCSGQAANPLFNTLCLEDDGFPRQPAANFQLLNQNNRPINCPPGPGNTCATTPWGTVDRTWTNAITTGASLQGINDDKIFGHDNYFTIGGSVDRSKIGFQGNSELGYIYPDFFVGPNAAVPGTGQIVRTAGNIGFAPVSLAAWNTYYGIYANDTFDITNRLSVTAGGRYNIAQISMADLLGTSPDLNAQYTFERFNPVVGFTYKILPELMTFYAGYSEANRAPTPLELGCSNPLRPCLLEGFLVSDPPLNQVVARTKEVGLRGNFNNAGGRGDWKLGLFRTDSESDIIQVASVLQGRGVFQNVPATRRQGLETGVNYQTERYLVYANYAMVDATYQFTGLLASPNNPSAERQRRHPGYARQADSRYSAPPDQGRRRLLGHAPVEAGYRRHLGQQPVVCRRRRQPERQAGGLLGRQPARLISAHQGAAALWRDQQSVQSQIRDVRYLFRPAVGHQRSVEPADRSPHHHAGATAGDLYGPPRQAVVSLSDVRIVIAACAVTNMIPKQGDTGVPEKIVLQHKELYRSPAMT